MNKPRRYLFTGTCTKKHVPVLQHGLKSKNNSKMITEGKFIGCENRHLIKT